MRNLLLIFLLLHILAFLHFPILKGAESNPPVFVETWAVSLDESPFEIFKRPRIAVGDDGTVCLADRVNKQLVLIDADGTFLRKLGQEGKGPGEFSTITSVGFQQDTRTFWVTDGQNGRLSIWNHQGLVEEVHGLGKWVMDMHAIPFLFQDQAFYLENNTGRKGLELVLNKMSLRDKKRIPLWKPKPYQRDVGLQHHEGKNNITARFAWDENYAMGIGRNTIYVLNSGDRYIWTLDREGNSGKSFTYTLPRIPVTDKDFDDEVSGLPEFIRNDLMDSISRPDFWPAVRRFIIDPEEQIWLLGYATEEKPAPLQIYRNDGVLIHQFRTKAVPDHVNRHSMYELSLDEDGEFRLVKRAIKW